MSSLGTDIDIDIDPSEVAAVIEGQSQLEETRLRGPGKVDPLLALELRLRWLEALILGVKQDLGKDRKGKGKEEYITVGAASTASAYLKHGETLVRLAETVQQKLDKAVEGNEGLRRFMDNCAFLQYSFPLTLLFIYH